MLKLEKIASVEDLLAWAKDINANITAHPDDTWKYQDIYAHSQHEDLARFFIEAEGERMLILCSVRNVMHHDEIEFLLKRLAQHKVSKEMEFYYGEFEKKETALNSRINAFKESMRPYHKRLADLRRRNEFLERTFAQLQSQEACAVENMRAAKREAAALREKADKYDNIRALLA